MSIFGFKNAIIETDNKIPLLLENIQKKIRLFIDENSRLQQLSFETNEAVENRKSIISIAAEHRGWLQKNMTFFNKFHKIPGYGYVVMKRGHIIAISINCLKFNDVPARIAVTVDGVQLEGSEISLTAENTTNYYNFERGFLVEAGSVINFIILMDNINTNFTYVSILFSF